MLNEQQHNNLSCSTQDQHINEAGSECEEGGGGAGPHLGTTWVSRLMPTVEKYTAISLTYCGAVQQGAQQYSTSRWGTAQHRRRG